MREIFLVFCFLLILSVFGCVNQRPSPILVNVDANVDDSNAFVRRDGSTPLTGSWDAQNSILVTSLTAGGTIKVPHNIPVIFGTTDTQIQGDPLGQLLLDGNVEVGLQGGRIDIDAGVNQNNQNGRNVLINAGSSGDFTSNGGNTFFTAGDGGGTPGNANVLGGDSTGTVGSAGGAVNITAGNGNSLGGLGGNINITAGQGLSSSNRGGFVNLLGGSGLSFDGYVRAGTCTSSHSFALQDDFIACSNFEADGKSFFDDDANINGTVDTTLGFGFAGTPGLTKTLFVRNAADSGSCYIDVNGGIITASDC